jgi:hypothetical protein
VHAPLPVKNNEALNDGARVIFLSTYEVRSDFLGTQANDVSTSVIFSFE